jgi:hypothetical protein
MTSSHGLTFLKRMTMEHSKGICMKIDELQLDLYQATIESIRSVR